MESTEQQEARRKDLDTLVFLLAAQPREGWDDIFDAARRREVERIFGRPDVGQEADRGE